MSNSISPPSYPETEVYTCPTPYPCDDDNSDNKNQIFFPNQEQSTENIICLNSLKSELKGITNIE